MSDSTYIIYHRTQGGGKGWSGYYVRVPSTPRKLFSIRVLGEDAAHRAAFQYRDAQVKRLGFKTVKALARSRMRINRSGVVGVHLERTTARYTYLGEVREYKSVRWVARWRVDGKRVQQYFSVAKYGYKGARARAIMARTANTG